MIKTNYVPVLLFSVVLFACKSKEPVSHENVITVKDVVAAFPVKKLTELIEEISDAELNELLQNGESPDWILTTTDSINDQLVIRNKMAEDNSVTFVLYRTKGDSVLVGVQQLNAQIMSTKFWRYSFDAVNKPDSVWASYAMPALNFEDFIAENVNLPQGYAGEEAAIYLDIKLLPDKVIFAINEWIFLREIANEYESDMNELSSSYVKYEWEWRWDGSRFTLSKTDSKDYEEAITVKASVIKENEDGPGVNEFDCPHGVSVRASAELAPQNNSSYAAASVLDGKDETAWAVPSGGIGQWISFTITKDFRIGGSYQIKTGYTKSKMLWNANNRVKKLKAFVNDKLTAHVLLQDTDDYQSFSIRPIWSKELMTDKPGDVIRFEIEEIYKGTKYDDTLISYFVPTGNCG